MIERLDAHQADLLVWSPDALGSVCFLVSSVLAEIAVWGPLVPARRSATLNLVGSVAFGISAVAAAIPNTDELLNASLATSTTLVSALCFFWAARVLVKPPPGCARSPPRRTSEARSRGGVSEPYCDLQPVLTSLEAAASSSGEAPSAEDRPSRKFRSRPRSGRGPRLRLLDHGPGDGWRHVAVEDRWDHIVLQVVVGNDFGDAARGRQLHLLGDPRGGVQGAAEDAWEAEHVVDLVRVVRTPGGHDPHVGLGDLGHHLGGRIGHREHDRVMAILPSDSGSSSPGPETPMNTSQPSITSSGPPERRTGWCSPRTSA